LRAFGALALTGLAAPALALPLDGEALDLPYWQCVPIARMLSGIEIYGDAHSWWDQAEGHYRKGNVPRRGAVLNFMPYGGMKLGHVAAVTRIIDDRTILVTHSNWSPFGGRRGFVEKNVRIIDVSEENDWRGDIHPTERMIDIRKSLFADPRPTGRLAYLSRALKAAR